MYTVAAGNAAAHAAAVEKRIESIQNIFSKFEFESRDGALIDSAEDHGPARWTAEEWAAIGVQGERKWLKQDLNGWAERVMERAKALEAAGPANSDDMEAAAERSVGAMGDDFKASVRRLRDIGMRILHIAALGDQQKLTTTAALRQELDSTVVTSLGEFSGIVDRSLESLRSRRVEVPPAEVFRSSALQQKVITKLEMQLAEREALLVTVRREADESYHALMRAEERTRQALSTSVQKPSQRMRAVQCQLPAGGSDVGVQVHLIGASDSDDDTVADSVAPSAAASLKRSALAGGSSRFSSFTSTAADASPRSGLAARRVNSRAGAGSPHEALVLQKRLDQYTIMFVALMALYKKSQERLKAKPPAPPARQMMTSFTQTKPMTQPQAQSPSSPPPTHPSILDDSVVISLLRADSEDGGDETRVRALMQMSSPHNSTENTASFVHDALATFVAAQEDQERDAVWSSIVGSAAVTHPNPKTTDKRTALKAGTSTAGGTPRRSMGKQNALGPEYRSDTMDHDSAPVPATRIPPIGNLVASSPRSDASKPRAKPHGASLGIQPTSSGAASPSSPSSPIRGDDMSLRAPPLAPTSTAVMTGTTQPHKRHTTTMSTQTDLKGDVTPSTSTSASQTASLQVEDVWVQTLLKIWGLLGDDDPSAVVALQPPRAVGVLRPPSQASTGGKVTPTPQGSRRVSPKSQHQPDGPQARQTVAAVVKRFQQEVSNVRNAQAPASAAPIARRPLTASLGGSAAARGQKKYSLLSDQDIAHVLGMESRHESDVAQFSRWREELQRLRTLDAEAVLVSPQVEVSSHHFPITRTPPALLHRDDYDDGVDDDHAHVRRRVVPPKTPRPVGVAAAPALQPTTLLTATGAVVDARGVSLDPSKAAALPAHAERPQPFHVPKIW